jgi:hypothetical protein
VGGTDRVDERLGDVLGARLASKVWGEDASGANLVDRTADLLTGNLVA